MMKILLMMILLVGSQICSATEIHGGGGIRFGLFSYNEDRLDTLKLSWGGQAKALIGDYFASEFSIQRREDSVSGRIGRVDITTYPIQLSGIVYPIKQRTVSPYFIAGFGWYKLNATGQVRIGPIDITQSISITESAPHIGVGVEAFVGDHFSAAFDVRKLFFEFQTPFGDFTTDALKYAYLVNIIANFYW